MLIDGAHNPDAAQSLAAFVKKYLADRKIILILGIMADKDIPGIMTPLLPLGSAVILTAPNYGRAASPAQLAEHARTLGFPGCLTVETIRESLSRAKKLSSSMAPGGDGIILITGSFFTIGEAKELLGERPILGDLREKL
ncbi:MAG TPA: cyanophycin synthetase, partial [Dissulfurispiraceae bacterium]|nr:cyanophycin synthetase [Dissulfurispiraceae bacterium]